MGRMGMRLRPVRVGDGEVLPQSPPPRVRMRMRLGLVRVGDAEVPSLRLLSRVSPLPLLPPLVTATSPSSVMVGTLLGVGTVLRLLSPLVSSSLVGTVLRLLSPLVSSSPM